MYKVNQTYRVTKSRDKLALIMLYHLQALISGKTATANLCTLLGDTARDLCSDLIF